MGIMMDLDKLVVPGLVNVYITIDRSTMFTGKTHFFDWAMFHSELLVYQAG